MVLELAAGGKGGHEDIGTLTWLGVLTVMLRGSWGKLTLGGEGRLVGTKPLLMVAFK